MSFVLSRVANAPSRLVIYPPATEVTVAPEVLMRRQPACALSLLISTYLLLSIAGCGGGTSSNGDNGNGGGGTPPSQVSITISPTSATVSASGTQQFHASVTDSSNTSVQWEVNQAPGGSSQTGTISNGGLYTAPPTTTPLQVTVTAVSQADPTKIASAAVTVNPINVPPGISVTISPTTATLAISTNQQFTAAVTGTNNTSVTWSVDGVAGGNTTVGTINTSGLYTAAATAGGHTVTATSVADNTKSASATVAVISLSVSPSSVNLAPKGVQQFTAAVQGTTNTAVSWSVNGVAGGNNTVGTITSGGLYTAPGSTGTYTVTATSAALPSYSVNASLNVINAPPGTASVLTFHNDDVRDGANTGETTLNPSNVNSQQFGKLFSYPVDGQIYAQPLYVPNLTVAGVLHNVVFVETENDTVYAFDGDGLSGSPLWQKHLATPLQVNDDEGIKPLLGITSTPVIDNATSTMYVVTDGSESGKKVFRLHALDLATGSERFGGPVIVTGTVPGTGQDSKNGQITLETDCYQRNGLALDPASNAVYISFGHCSHGWILAYDKASLQQIAIMNDTADGAGGGLWGGTPAVDDTTGDLYLISGVDLDDPAPDYNDSFLRLQDTSLNVLDFFKPSNEQLLRDNDADLGSGSCIIMPDNPSQYPHELIGGGKDGRIFVVNRDNMGQYQMSDHVIQEVQSGTQQYDNIFSTPTLWNNTIYYHEAQDVVQAFSWDPNTGLISSSPTMQGTIVYGGHGANTSVSSNGGSDGILWDLDTSKSKSGGAAILHAYAAGNLKNELYNSSQAGGRDIAGPAVKFTLPTIADGHVYVGTASELDIYGLLAQ